MQRRILLVVIVTAAIFLSAAASPLRADVRDLYCYLEASSVDVRVEVWEQDNSGNKGYLLWKGVIRQGQRKRINTRFGNIRLATSINVDQNEALSGDKSRWCESGSTVGVP